MLNPIVLSSLIPVMLLIGVGLIAARVGWIRAEATKDLATLVFSVLTPALLFRTMSTVHVEQLQFRPVAAYFVAACCLFFTLLVWRGGNARSAVLALGATFSNTVAIGIPLISLAYGQEGLVTLFTLISLHALILLTLATVVLELSLARSSQANADGPTGRGRAVLDALRNGILHPIPLPILLGLAFAQTGWVLPEVVDRPLMLLGNAMGPLALVLVGATLASARVGSQLKDALAMTALKNLALPALVATVGLIAGLDGLPLTVMVVAGALPIGANVFMFSQRYGVAQELITAAVAVSTASAILSISLVMALVNYL
jgi:predicted permease